MTLNRKLRKLFLLVAALFLCTGQLAAREITADSMFYVARFQSDKLAAISYTFDDGVLEHFTLVYPAFEKLGLKGTFWINGNTINEGEKGLYNKLPRISWKDLKTMAEHGHEISNHGWSHKNLTECTKEEMQVEVDRNDSIIEAKIGVRPITFCYAGNRKNEEVVRFVSQNRVGTRTSQFSVGGKSTPENLDDRIKQLMADREWGVTMTHGITYGYDAFTSDSIFWNHLKRVKSLEDQIWVATFKEVAAYTAEQKCVRLQVDARQGKWVVTPISTLDKKLFDYPLTMVVRQKGLRKISVKQGGRRLKTTLLPDKALVEFDPNGESMFVQMTISL